MASDSLETSTVDPDVVLEEQCTGYRRYRNLITGRRWEVIGECAWTDPTRWGPCGEGSPEPPPGASKGRLDIPITPELICPLCVDGGYLRFRELKRYAD